MFNFYVAYTMRNVLNIAITEMVHRDYSNGTVYDDTCPDTAGTVSEREGYDWSEQMQGIILGAFYWGYAATHVPGGVISARYGGKYTLSLGILSTAIFTLLTPMAVRYGKDELTASNPIRN